MARRTKWEDTLLSISVASGAGSTQSLMGSVTPNESEGETIVRCIGDLWLFSTTVAGAWGAEQVDIGIGVVAQEAFAAGVTSDPNTADEEPRGGWIYRHRCVVGQNGAGAQFILHCPFDIRSARKIDGDELFVRFNMTNAIGTSFAVGVVGLIRALIKLP